MSLLNSDRELLTEALREPESVNRVNDTLRVLVLLVFGAIVMAGAYLYFNPPTRCVTAEGATICQGGH